MSSDLYTFDISFNRNSSSNTFSNDRNRDTLFSSVPYYPFLSTSPIDITQGYLNNSLDPFSASFYLYHLENQILSDFQSNISNNDHNTKFSALDCSEVKSEECQIGGVDYYTYKYNQQFLPQSESVSKLIQRSFSCDSIDGKPRFPLEANLDCLMDSPNFQWKYLSSPEDSFFTREMRKVCSAGDLQNMKATHASPSLEEANFKVGRYSAEERKEKISKYRAKRSQRKFNKIIKYACRKTLADNRTRIRGRFARNDETTEIPKAPSSTTEEHEHEDEFWVELIEGFNQELLS